MKITKYIQRNCMGCGICHSADGINMIKDKKGFYFPEISKNQDINEESITYCPVFNYSSKDKEFHLWGNYDSVYKGYSLDEDIRYRASSGGALTSISLFLLDNGIVDGIIHTGVSKKDPMATDTFVSKTRLDLLEHIGSRYSISIPLANICSIVEEGKKYAFIGKPCDVAALRRYLECNKNLREQIIFMMSFFCAGMPSNDANLKLLNKMGCSKGKIKSLQYRGNGWPGYTTAIDCDGKLYQIDYQTAWGEYLGRDVNKICRFCMDGIGEFADIVCADLWYLDKNNKPVFLENDGRNIVFCRNALANHILKQAVCNGYVHMKSCVNIMDHFEFYQPYQFSRRVTMKYKLIAMKFFGRHIPRYSRNLLNSASKYATSNMKWSIFKGTVKRILQNKL